MLSDPAFCLEPFLGFSDSSRSYLDAPCRTNLLVQKQLSGLGQWPQVFPSRLQSKNEGWDSLLTF